MTNLIWRLLQACTNSNNHLSGMPFVAFLLASLGYPPTGTYPYVPLTPRQGYVLLRGMGMGWVVDTREFTPILL